MIRTFKIYIMMTRALRKYFINIKYNIHHYMFHEGIAPKGI